MLEIVSFIATSVLSFVGGAVVFNFRQSGKLSLRETIRDFVSGGPGPREK